MATRTITLVTIDPVPGAVKRTVYATCDACSWTSATQLANVSGRVIAHAEAAGHTCGQGPPEWAQRPLW